MVTKQKNRGRNGRSKKKFTPNVVLPDLSSLRLESEPNLRFPTELFGVIAQFLVGMHAFGTAASLNVASRSIRDETTPVLYETFLTDNLFASTYYAERVPLPEGAKYTKYLLCHSGIVPVAYRLDDFPNIIMTLENVRNDKEGGYSVHLTLHKPVSSATLFGVILKTPLHHRPFDHEWCGYAFKDLDHGAPYDPEACEACEAEDAKPAVRAPETLFTMHLAEGAYLIPDKKPLDWTTDIRLHNLQFVRPTAQGIVYDEPIQQEDEPMLDTIFELLKLPARSSREGGVRAFDAALEIPQACKARTLYEQWYISLTFSPDALMKFMDRFDEVRLEHPKVCLNRLKIVVYICLGRQGFQNLLTDVVPYLIHPAASVSNYSVGLGPRHPVIAIASCFQPDDRGVPIRHVALVCAIPAKGSRVSFTMTDAIFTEERPEEGRYRNHDMRRILAQCQGREVTPVRERFTMRLG